VISYNDDRNIFTVPNELIDAPADRLFYQNLKTLLIGNNGRKGK